MKKYTQDEKKEIYKKWRTLINMSPSELKKWLRNPWKLKASLSKDQASAYGIVSGHTSFSQIVDMVELAFNDWNDEDFANARRHNSFNSRMLGGNPGQPVSKDVPMSKWEISLRNWGHDPRKPNSPGYKKAMDWLKEQDLANEVEEEEIEESEDLEDEDEEDTKLSFDKEDKVSIVKIIARKLREV